MGTGSEGIRIVAIKGSVRLGNYTSKALALVTDEIETSHPAITLDVVDPATMNLPLPGTAPDSSEAKELRELVRKANGVILATPEYHGGFSSVMKLVIENLGHPSVLSGKPVALLGVAGGRIGAIKSFENLRSVCSHVGAIVLPGPVSVANVRQVFEKDGRINDAGIEREVRGLATSLIDFIRQGLCPRVALESMVRQGVV